MTLQKDTEVFDPDTTCPKSVRLPCEVCRANHEPLAV
jgi:hypothetical protein